MTGELDTYTAACVEQAVTDFGDLTGDRAADLVVDLSWLTFIDSDGLRLIEEFVARVQKTGARASLHSPSPCVRRLLRITGVDLTVPTCHVLVDERSGT